MLRTHCSTLVYIMLFCEWVPKLCTCLYIRHKLDVRYMYDMHTLKGTATLMISMFIRKNSMNHEF